MGFLPLAIIVWLAAMLAWYVVSKYFKSSDADKVKQRLMGVARKQTKSAKDGQQSVIHTQQSGNKFAQLLVEKYQLGPKIQLLLEQAGLRWTPARLVHLTIMAFGAGLVFAWMALPGAIPRAFAFLVGLAVAPGPFWTPLQVTGGQPSEKLPSFGEDTPMGRPGQPAELAGIYVLLASNEDSYATGQVYGAVGGRGGP